MLINSLIPIVTINSHGILEKNTKRSAHFMSSFSGDNTAKDQQAHRRDAQARKRRGTGARTQSNAVQVDPKEAARYVPRHQNAYLHADSKAVIEEWLQSQDRTSVLTSFNFREFAQIGIRNGEGKLVPLKVIMAGADARAVGMDDKPVVITDKGFETPEGGQLPVLVFSITLITNPGSTPLCGVRFKIDRDTKRVFVS